MRGERRPVASRKDPGCPPHPREFTREHVPSRRHWNSSLRCSAHNTMHTPCVKEWGATQRPRTSSPDSSPPTTSMMPLERVTDLHRRVPNVCRQTHRQRHDWPSRCQPNGYLRGRGFESRMGRTPVRGFGGWEGSERTRSRSSKQRVGHAHQDDHHARAGTPCAVSRVLSVKSSVATVRGARK